MLSKLLATSLAGLACAQDLTLQSSEGDEPKPMSQLDIFANLVLDKMDTPFFPPMADYHEEFKKLEAKRLNGELVGSDAFKTMCELAIAQNLSCTAYAVTTSDGYILNVWRVN